MMFDVHGWLVEVIRSLAPKAKNPETFISVRDANDFITTAAKIKLRAFGGYSNVTGANVLFLSSFCVLFRHHHSSVGLFTANGTVQQLPTTCRSTVIARCLSNSDSVMTYTPSY